MDLDELEKLARAATEGPWYAIKEEDDGVSGYICEMDPALDGGRVHAIVNDRRRVNGVPDADSGFIAAANPQAILELIERLREAEDAMTTSNEAVSAYFDKWFADRG